MLALAQSVKIDTGRCDNTYPYLIKNIIRGDTMTKNILTQEVLKELIDYNPDTGIFTWLYRDRKYFKWDGSWKTFNTVYPGEIAGCENPHGYLLIGIFDKIYQAHRLAFLYQEGINPPEEVDHINGARGDNSWANLRLASRTDNARNMKVSSRNKTGVIGVCWDRSREKYKISICANSKSVELGRLDDFFEAVCVRKSAELRYGYHSNHGRLN